MQSWATKVFSSDDSGTAPDNTRIDGTIVSSKPLCFSGNIIEDFTLTYKAGVLGHEDFMVGTKDLSIVGITETGEEIKIFINGDFVI